MKKSVLNKIVVTGLVCLSFGGTVVSFASDYSGHEIVSNSKQVLEEQAIIQNGDFSNGFDRWIVSNPGTDNPTIVEENGNKYVLAKYGENIHQYLSLEPSTTYTFSYDVAGSENFPAKVEFGTMNHGEDFIALEESEHNNEDWSRQQFTFTTLEKENSYIIRFSSTGSGWAKFDNIQVEPEQSETSMLSVNVVSRQAFANLHLDSERFNSAERIMVYVDGKYHFETYEGISYYSFTENNMNNVQVSRRISGEKGQVIEVYNAPGKPGQSSEGKQLLEKITLESDLATDSDLLEGAVNDINLTGKQLSVDFNRDIFEGDNRMIIRKNGKYLAEVYKGKHYYSRINVGKESVKLIKDIDFEVGDIISVELSSGLPGSASDTLQVLETYEVI